MSLALTAEKAFSFFQLSSMINRHIRARLDSVPRPDDAPFANVAGPRPLQVFLYGSGPAVGWGVHSHSLALPGQLAREIASTHRRGINVELQADSTVTAATARERLGSRQLLQYDVIIVSLGANDAMALTPEAEWQASMEEFLRHIIRESSIHTEFIVVGIPPLGPLPAFNSPLGKLASRHGEVLNDATEQVCAGLAQARFVPLPALANLSKGSHRSPRVYRQWARLIASRLQEVLPLGR